MDGVCSRNSTLKLIGTKVKQKRYVHSRAGTFLLKIIPFTCALLFSYSGIRAQDKLPQDSLTTALCNNEEQIVSRRISEWRIGYYMGETELNMKTMAGFLSLNSASKPLYSQYRLKKTAGWVLVVGGIAMIIADGQLTKPAFPVWSIGGVAVSVTGLVVGFKSNGTFRKTIHAYNRDICNIK